MICNVSSKVFPTTLKNNQTKLIICDLKTLVLSVIAATTTYLWIKLYKIIETLNLCIQHCCNDVYLLF